MAARKKGAKQAKKPATPETLEPNMRSEQPAALTAQNIDPAFVYSIGTNKQPKGLGFVVRVSHEPATLERLPLDADRRRFFIFEPVEGQEQRAITIEDAFALGITSLRRKDRDDQIAWEQWMSVHYVKPE